MWVEYSKLNFQYTRILGNDIVWQAIYLTTCLFRSLLIQSFFSSVKSRQIVHFKCTENTEDKKWRLNYRVIGIEVRYTCIKIVFSRKKKYSQDRLKTFIHKNIVYHMKKNWNSPLQASFSGSIMSEYFGIRKFSLLLKIFRSIENSIPKRKINHLSYW